MAELPDIAGDWPDDGASDEAARDFGRRLAMDGLLRHALRHSGAVHAHLRPAARRNIQFVVWAAAAAAVLVTVGGLWWGSQRSEARGQKTEVALHPSAFSLQPLAFVTAVAGDCRLQNAACKIGDKLVEGAKIDTGKGGLLKFEYAGEKTELVVGEVSSVECRVSKKGEKSLYLSVGQMTATVAKQAPGRQFVVETPLARMTVVGTRFSLQSQLSGTRLDVAEGSVEMVALASGRKMVVEAEHQGLIRPGENAPKLYGQVLFEDHFDKGLANWDIWISEAKYNTKTMVWDIGLRSASPAEASRARIFDNPSGGGKCLAIDATGLTAGGMALELKNAIKDAPVMSESATMSCNVRFSQLMDNDNSGGGKAWGGLQLLLSVPNEQVYEREYEPHLMTGTWERNEVEWDFKRVKGGDGRVFSSRGGTGETLFFESRRRLSDTNQPPFCVIMLRVVKAVAYFDNVVIRTRAPDVD